MCIDLGWGFVAGVAVMRRVTVIFNLINFWNKSQGEIHGIVKGSGLGIVPRLERFRINGLTRHVPKPK